jgi:hypothetical protein
MDGKGIHLQGQSPCHRTTGASANSHLEEARRVTTAARRGRVATHIIGRQSLRRDWGIRGGGRDGDRGRGGGVLRCCHFLGRDRVALTEGLRFRHVCWSRIWYVRNWHRSKTGGQRGRITFLICLYACQFLSWYRRLGVLSVLYISTITHMRCSRSAFATQQ